MKFTKTGYSQWALDDAKDLRIKLSDFIDNIELIANVSDFIDDSDIDNLLGALNVLDEFIESYDIFATVQAYEARKMRKGIKDEI